MVLAYVTSLFNDELHIVDETHALSPWHLIGSSLVPKCVRSHCTHVNEQDIGVDDYKSLNSKCPPLHIHVHHQLQ